MARDESKTELSGNVLQMKVRVSKTKTVAELAPNGVHHPMNPQTHGINKINLIF